MGGVGGSAAEALARSGVGTLVLIDGDSVDQSNLNRQIFATVNTIGIPKAMAAKERLLSIDPGLTVHTKIVYVTAGNARELLQPKPHMIIDAIDNMLQKLDMIEYAHQNGIDIISAGGAGNRLSSVGMRCANVFDTSGDPLCRIMRRELRKRGIESHRVVYVPERMDIVQNPPASMVFVPASMGLMLAQEAVISITEGDRA